MEIKIKQLEYTVIFEPAEEGGYIVHIPFLDGIVTQGDTLAEAKAMAKDLIQGYLETLKKKGLPLPQEKFTFKPHIEKLAIAV
ncbi:MAG: type II toxin-antitoxin system HicB family antitoxin [Candidatus Komeilibacteria bacterium]|nr:type II toxin-antitoxin system HicB family antitoxin [Candidatus Komeilibacteria bacterium]